MKEFYNESNFSLTIKQNIMKTYFKMMIAVVCIVCFAACNEDLPSGPQIDSDQQLESLTKRTCGTTEFMLDIMQNPEKRKLHEDKVLRFKKFAQSRSAESSELCANPTVLPVAIHFQGVTNPNNACLISLAQSQVEILNNDYQGQNADITNWNNNASSSFPGINNGEACIEFCIANQSHPTGYNLNDGDLAVTINQTSGDTEPAWSGYLNIFVQFDTGLLGYSPLGGSGNGDGVVIDANAFGAGIGCGDIAPNAPFDLGRTLTHELGHYLFLDHIWGGGCSQDDNISDTPESANPYYDCPNIGASSCGSTDMHMNYMDYVNDACMYMFSEGQATTMENYVSSNLSGLVQNALIVCSQESGNDDSEEEGEEEEEEECQSPTDAEVSDITSNSSLVSWTAIPNVIKYRLLYKAEGASVWTKRTTTASSIFIEDLQASTNYIWKIRSRCPSGWEPFSPISQFTTAADEQEEEEEDETDCTNIVFELVLDDYGSETSWELVDSYGEQFANGGNYSDGQNGQLVNEEFCLEDGCYTLYVDDAYGDGICCFYGEGYFQLLDVSGDIIAHSDGYFGYYDYLDLCVENGDVYLSKEKKDTKSTSLSRKPLLTYKSGK